MEQIVQLNSKANLSEHFVLGEFTRSKYPEVYNIPSHEVISHLKNLCVWLEALREEYNRKYGEGFALGSGPSRMVPPPTGTRPHCRSLWLHFAVRPSGNRRKVRFIQT